MSRNKKPTCSFCRGKIRGSSTEIVFHPITRQPGTPTPAVHRLHRRCVDAFIGIHRLLSTRMYHLTEIDGYFPPRY